MYPEVMTMTMDRATVEWTDAEATRIVVDNPPSKIALTLFLGVFTVIGWFVGRAWFFLAKIVPLVVLACRYGYRQGAKIPVELKAQQPSMPA